ncbi:MAG: alpha/beta fold hydrolase [Sphingorhabdus sp.]
MVEILYFKRPEAPQLAYRLARGAGPLIVFLPGYMSDMAGGKATAVFDWAEANGRNCLLLDYSGCGMSEGDFKDGTLSRWRDEVLALIAHVGADEVVLVGSSMGGWLMLLVGLALDARLKGLIGIAPAPDFTRWGFADTQKATIRDQGVLYQPNPYGPEPTPTWHGLYADGVAHEMLDDEIAISCPVRLLHGQADADVPWEISLRLAKALRSDDVRVILIKDGDHRLSRETDIASLIDAVAGMAGG